MNVRYPKIFLGKIQNKRGSVLLATYLITTLLLGLGAAFLLISTGERKAADIERKTTQAFYIAEAGVEQAIYDLRQDFVVDESWANGVTISSTTYGPDTSAFYSIYSSVTFPSGSYSDSFSKTGANTYSVSFKNVSGTESIWVRSTGVVDGISQSIQLYLKITSLSPWENAIFAGAGASGQMINGNVDIRGSVHILGTGLADGDNAILMGGTAELVGNNYKDMPSGLEAKVPVLPTVIIPGESNPSETLYAELRVKKGIVSLSGSASVGEDTKISDIDNGEKENVDGIYVSDGFAGSGGAGSVYSDNSTSTGYDLGDALSFPSLSDPAPEDAGQTVQEYFESQTGFDAATQANLIAHLSNVKDTDAFEDYQDVNGNSVFDSGDNGISMDGNGNMVVYGRVYVAGPVNIGGDPADPSDSSAPINYLGKGTILAEGDISITTSFTTSGSNSFPTNIVGIMTPGDMILGESSQLDVMGLFYAENEVVTNKQTNVVGTLVTNYFDTGGQVPAIFQVPETANNLPVGMISDDPVLLITIVSWQKI